MFMQFTFTNACIYTNKSKQFTIYIGTCRVSEKLVEKRKALITQSFNSFLNSSMNRWKIREDNTSRLKAYMQGQNQ